VKGWHRDRWAHLPLGVYERPLAMNAISYPQGLDDELGPLRVIPGSHVQPLRMQEDERHQPHPQEVLLRPGPCDLILTHHGLVHSGTTNISGKTRYFLSLYLNHSWLKSTEDPSGPVCRGLAAEAGAAGDVRLQRFLGQDPTLKQRNNWGFMQEEDERFAQWAAEDRTRP
ncbi:MAG: phytanoyl-CoA dioxygenase family protein, partial [Planctomycetota bacterium]